MWGLRGFNIIVNPGKPPRMPEKRVAKEKRKG